jgi:Protein of unknown function (DUF2849)
MAQAKRPPLPVILLANDLLDGDIVFWTGSAWSRQLGDAATAGDEHGAAQLEGAMAQELAANRVVDAGLVDVTLDAAGKATPRHVRERIKTLGPTVRLDLGKQAEQQQART